MVNVDDLRTYIRNIPDFPKKGIVFRDITTLLQHRYAFSSAIDKLYEYFKHKSIESVVGIEARGFILGGALAHSLQAGFVPVRKPNKLPSKVARQQYQLEYGNDALEIHTDAITKGERILIIDDLLATGGTAAATCKLVQQLQGTIVGVAFLIELSFLKGREQLDGYDVFSLIKYDSE